MEDLFFDKVGKRYFPHAYFAARNLVLLGIIGSTFFWILGGWDSTVESSLLGQSAYGYGIHWSTVQTLFGAFYFLAVNMQVGGISSFRQLGRELRRDLVSIFEEGRIIAGLLRRRKGTKERWFRLQASYDSYASVDPVRGFCFAAGFTLVATMIFEVIWVPIYDQVNFGNWAWPVYYFGRPLFGNPLLSPIFLRNNIEMGVLGVLGVLMLYLALDGDPKNHWPRFSVRWRLDRYAFVLLLLACASWLVWVFMPHQVVSAESILSQPSLIQSFHGVTEAQLQSTKWLFPSQTLFPQTEYTFYNASSYLKTYAENEIYGFYIDEPLVHLANIVTKYLTFAAVCYPALVFVTLNKKKAGHQTA